jgi:hypothetical protein
VPESRSTSPPRNQLFSMPAPVGSDHALIIAGGRAMPLCSPMLVCDKRRLRRRPDA